MAKKIDLNKCKPGDKLQTRQGNVVTYVEKVVGAKWPHYIRYADGYCGSRTDDGFVYASYTNRNPEEDEDIVAILPRKTKKASGSKPNMVRRCPLCNHWLPKVLWTEIRAPSFIVNVCEDCLTKHGYGY